MTFSEFLETVPANVFTGIEKLFQFNDGKREVIDHSLSLRCENHLCKGVRRFDPSSRILSGIYMCNEYLIYTCRNCKKTRKVFAVQFSFSDKMDVSGNVMKYGEDPAFGPSVPSRVITLLGPDRELFLKGRRSEVQGLGVGAFAYYRQAVENQKGRLLNEVARVAKRVGLNQEVIDKIERAAIEQQFHKAMNDIKDVMPESLLINGHNPFTLLHGALSKGIHGWTDAECLSRATAVRHVLTELAGRLGELLNDKNELDDAISTLMNLENPASSK